MAINVRDGRCGLTRIVQEADGGFTTSAVLAGIAPIVENHYPPMNVTKTGYVLPFALVRCVGTVNNTDPDTFLDSINLDDASIIAGVNYLETAAVLASGRAAQIIS